MKKIIYIANSRIPTEKAHGIQIMKMCQAFAKIGNKVTLVLPRRRNPIIADPFEYYVVSQSFNIIKLPTIDLVFLGKIGFLIQSLSFAISAFIFLLFQKADVVYARDELALFLLSLNGKRFVWETHTPKNNFISRRVTHRAVSVVAITKSLGEFYAKLGVPENKILIAPDGVDLEQFNISDTKEGARKKLGLPVQEKIILYAGHLYAWKGVDILALAAPLLPENTNVIFIGGTEKDIKAFKSKYGSTKNVRILGKKPYGQMPLYMRAADVLVIPNSAKDDVSRLYTSPMKLFEYMASGTPIVASDLPSVREILDDSMAYFFKPDDERSLKESINKVLASEKNLNNSVDKAKEYSWDNRAIKVIELLK